VTDRTDHGEAAIRIASGLPAANVRCDDAYMNDIHPGHPHDLGPHLHAHSAPTTQQIRTVGQRRREAEEKLEHHLEEARAKSEHHETAEGDTESAHGGAPVVDGEDVAAIQNDDQLTAADRVDLIANQVVPEEDDNKASGGGG
jgi:hypothetical protein